MGIDDFMVRRALRSPLDPTIHRQLSDAVVRLRPEITARLESAGLLEFVNQFHPEKFNPDTPLGSNLLYALPKHSLTQRELAEDQSFVRILRDEGIEHELAQLATHLVESLIATFGKDGTDHPLFRRLNMDDELYSQLSAIVKTRKLEGNDALAPKDYALMLTVPFAFSPFRRLPAHASD